jgi:hypothetical protein
MTGFISEFKSNSYAAVSPAGPAPMMIAVFLFISALLSGKQYYFTREKVPEEDEYRGNDFRSENFSLHIGDYDHGSEKHVREKPDERGVHSEPDKTDHGENKKLGAVLLRRPLRKNPSDAQMVIHEKSRDERNTRREKIMRLKKQRHGQYEQHSEIGDKRDSSDNAVSEKLHNRIVVFRDKKKFDIFFHNRPFVNTHGTGKTASTEIPVPDTPPEANIIRIASAGNSQIKAIHFSSLTIPEEIRSGNYFNAFSYLR